MNDSTMNDSVQHHSTSANICCCDTAVSSAFLCHCQSHIATHIRVRGLAQQVAVSLLFVCCCCFGVAAMVHVYTGQPLLTCVAPGNGQSNGGSRAAAGVCRLFWIAKILRHGTPLYPQPLCLRCRRRRLIWCCCWQHQEDHSPAAWHTIVPPALVYEVA